MKEWKRMTYQSLVSSEEDATGRIFMCPKLVDKSPLIRDLNSIRFLAMGVDTIRQLYRGALNWSAWKERFEDPGQHTVIWLAGMQFAVSRTGKASGFQYVARNEHEGLTVLVKSAHSTVDNEATHVKIEVSPRVARSKTPADLQRDMDRIAGQLFRGDFECAGVAIHLALDFQGWNPPAAFAKRLRTRARHVFEGEGMGRVELDASGIAASYNNRETVTVGRPGSVQVSMYRKDIEMQRSDKVDYWTGVWSGHDPSKAVWRLEVRFHHSVVAELLRDIGVSGDNYRTAAEHLTGLWRYALKANQLEHSKDILDPAWQLFRDDADFGRLQAVPSKREKKEDVSAIRHNIHLVIGNMCTMVSRMGSDIATLAETLYNDLRFLTIWDAIRKHYYEERGWTDRDFRDYLYKSVQQRILCGKAA